MDFDTLKSLSGNFENLQRAVEDLKPKFPGADDDTFWQPTVGADGNGFALIRWLPTPYVDIEKYGKDVARPFARIFRRSFQGPTTNEWYIENCLTSLNKKDPVNELVRALWKSEDPRDVELRKLYKRKQQYISNIWVVEDRGNPDNNGKMFKFRYGPKIWEKLDDAMFPKIGAKLDPFDLFKGANFGLVITTKDNFRNYNSSKFDERAPFPGSEEDYVKIWKQEYSLLNFEQPDQFKSYEELEARLNSVLEFTYEDRGTQSTKASSPSRVSEGGVSSLAALAAVQQPAKQQVTPPKTTIAEDLKGDSVDPEDSSDSDLDYFKNLAKEV